MLKANMRLVPSRKGLVNPQTLKREFLADGWFRIEGTEKLTKRSLIKPGRTIVLVAHPTTTRTIALGRVRLGKATNHICRAASCEVKLTRE